MIPIEFKEQNDVLGKPASLTDEECVSLPCYRNGTEVISKWELTEEEKREILANGYIWIRCISGNSAPPILPQIISPFGQV